MSLLGLSALGALGWRYWLGALIVFLAARYLYTQAKYAYLARKWKTKPVKDALNWYFGYDLWKKMSENTKDGHWSEYVKLRYEDLDCHTYRMRTPFRYLYQTMNPENIKAMVATQFEDYTIGVRRPIMLPLLGDGVFASDGDKWKYARGVLKPQFSREQISHVKLVERHFQNFAKHIQNTRGQEFDIQALFTRLTLDALLEFLLGESVNLLMDELIGFDPSQLRLNAKSEFDDAYKTTERLMTARAIMMDAYWLGNTKEFRDSVKKVHKFVTSYVDRALALSPEELEKKNQELYTILYQLAKETRDGKKLRDHLINIMLAGRSTTASLLLSVFYELARHPEVWEQLKEVVYQTFGTGSEDDIGEITFESLKRCTYLKWVINETLRMYPPVAQNFREARRDTTLPRGGGPDGKLPILIPKGTRILYQLYATQRQTLHFGEDAEEFRPLRWEKVAMGWSFMPFGSGPRICLGQQFALTEASYIVVRMAQMFPNLLTNDLVYPPRKTNGAVMIYLDGVKVNIS